MNIGECFRKMLYARQEVSRNPWKSCVFGPPSTAAYCGVNTNGALSRLNPNFSLKLPRKCPKSMSAQNVRRREDDDIQKPAIKDDTRCATEEERMRSETERDVGAWTHGISDPASSP